MDEARTIRIGILGTGRVTAYALLEPARSMRGIEIAAVASRSPERARAFAELHAIPKTHSSYAALLDDADIDAVYIALPTGLHAAGTMRALASGKHVLCEKPLAVNASSARQMVTAARERDLVLQEGMHLLHLAALRRQRQLARDGEFGRIVSIASTFRHPNIPMLPDDFRLRFELGGGAALDLGCYAVACLRYVAGEEPVVTGARAECCAPEVDCWLQARLALPSGATGVAECGFRGAYAPKFAVEVRCEHGSISWSPEGLTCVNRGVVRREPLPLIATYRLQLEAFAKQIRREVAVAPADGAVATASILDASFARAGLAPRVVAELP